MKSLKVEFNDKPILILYDSNNIWVKAKDVANIFEYKDSKHAIRDNVDEINILTFKNFEEDFTPPLNLHPNTSFINENGLKELIFKSKRKIEYFDTFIYNLIDNIKNDQLLRDFSIEKKLNIFEFMNVNNLKLSNDPYFLELWSNLDEKDEILITNNLLYFLGFLDEKNMTRNYSHDIRSIKGHFIEFLKENSINYIQINYQDERIKKYKYIQNEIEECDSRTLHSKRWILMNIEDFKEAVLSLNNNKSKVAKKYYIQLEKIFKLYCKYSYEYDLKLENVKSIKAIQEKEIEKNQLQDENKQLKITNMNIQNFIDNTKEKSKTGYIYIATSKRYAAMNSFKVGKTDNLKTRLSQFNCSHIKNDLFYICYYEKVFNPHKTEQIIHDVLDDFRDKKGKEIFILHYTTLLEVVKLIIKNINEPYDYINNIIKHKLSQMYELRPIIPDKIEIDEEKLALEELKEKIDKILDEALTKGIFKMSRQELINKLDLSGNKIDLWNGFKKIIKWSNSNIPIKYKGKILSLLIDKSIKIESIK